MPDGVEVENGADPLDPDTDDDGILDGPDGLGDEDGDGIINVLDPREATVDETPDEPEVSVGDDLESLSGGAGVNPNCGCSQGVHEGGLAPALLLALLALAPLRRRRRS
jgi:uncharacterized protein (TIGR03382 family)